jgi:hypothetical protein
LAVIGWQAASRTAVHNENDTRIERGIEAPITNNGPDQAIASGLRQLYKPPTACDNTIWP